MRQFRRNYALIPRPVGAVSEPHRLCVKQVHTGFRVSSGSVRKPNLPVWEDAKLTPMVRFPNRTIGVNLREYHYISVRVVRNIYSPQYQDGTEP